MSGKNNVNPDHYKTAGRDTPDDNAAARQEIAATAGRKPRRKKGASTANFIPGAPPVGARAEDEKRKTSEDERG